MATKRKMLLQMEQMKQDIATLRTLCKAYIRKNDQLEAEIATLNAVLDCATEETERWKKIAQGGKERRHVHVRANIKPSD